MSKLQDIKQALYQIGQRYPTLLGVLSKEAGKATVGHHWAGILEPFELDDILDACDLYSSARKPIPKPAEGIIFEIREYCSDAQYKREAQLEQYAKYHRDIRLKKLRRLSDCIPTRGEKEAIAAHVAVDIGDAVKAGNMTRKESARRMDQLCDWAFRAADEPEWLKDDQQAEETTAYNVPDPFGDAAGLQA